jgi:hypothetical protein
MTEEVDEFGGEGLTPSALKQISELANRQLDLERQVEEATAKVKTLNEELKEVSENLLPNAMLEAGGLVSFTLATGESIEIKKDIYCSVPKEGFPEAEAWLRARGLEGVIKHQVTMLFGKGEDDQAVKAATLLLDNGFAPTDSKTIHPQTLKALLREQLGQGVDVPLKTFGAFEATKSKITLPKR